MFEFTSFIHGIIIGLLVLFFVMLGSDRVIQSKKEIIPELKIIVIDGESDTTFIYREE